MIFLKPFPGKHVRHPETKQLLTEEGVKVASIDTYWHRRLQDKDVFVSEPQEVTAEKPEPKNKKQGV